MFNSNASQIFKAMPASMVKNIEVITNPGAKYDAEGTSCILNININHNGSNSTAANINGYNGSVSAMAGTRGYRGSASVSGQQGKFSYNAMGLYNYSKQNGTEVQFDRSQSTAPICITIRKDKNHTPLHDGEYRPGIGT
jgi:hypothetical protein